MLFGGISSSRFPEATETDVRKFLTGCEIQSIRIVYDRATGEPRGVAFVDFPETAEVRAPAGPCVSWPLSLGEPWRPSHQLTNSDTHVSRFPLRPMPDHFLPA